MFFCTASAAAEAQSPEDARWIDRAKSTSVDQIEDGFPKERFDVWFADLVKPSETMYEVHGCHERLPSGRESQQPLLCVIASVKPPHPGWNSWLVLDLVVGKLATPGRPGEPAAVMPVPFRFSGACEGPSDPRMKRPDHCFSKLKDVEDYVRKLKK